MATSTTHDFRVEDDIWRAAMQRASSEGTNVSKVIKARLRVYGRPLASAAPTHAPRDLVNDVLALSPRVRPDPNLYLATIGAEDLLRSLGVRPELSQDAGTPTPIPAGTKRNARIDDETWEPVEQRTAEEGTTPSEVIRDRVALYAHPVPSDAPSRDPWDLINLVAREHGVARGTDLDLAEEIAADLLRALGIRPVPGYRGDA